MIEAFKPQIVLSGVLAALIGFAAAFAVVIAGLQAVGATDQQAISGLAILCVTQGLAAVFLSLKWRMPIAVAWSTPGAALLLSVSAPQGGYGEAVGAFMLSSLMLVLSGFVGWIRQAVQKIPTNLSSAMLAGVLFNICVVPVTSLIQAPLIIGPVIAVWFLVSLRWKMLALPAAVVAAAMVCTVGGFLPDQVVWQVTEFVWVNPQWSVASAVGIALPLFLVTMSSQNLAGVAVLKANGYSAPLSSALKTTGGLSVLNGVFGGHHINLAAITAAMCANPDVDPDPKLRYGAAVTNGLVYLVLGLVTSVVMQFALASPPNLIETLGGLALLAAFAGAMTQAVGGERGKEAAVVCFIVTASGISLFSIGSAFWGLVAGGLMYWLKP